MVSGAGASRVVRQAARPPDGAIPDPSAAPHRAADVPYPDVGHQERQDCYNGEQKEGERVNVSGREVAGSGVSLGSTQ